MNMTQSIVDQILTASLVALRHEPRVVKKINKKANVRANRAARIDENQDMGPWPLSRMTFEPLPALPEIRSYDFNHPSRKT